jgi:GDP-4-dehydro-6-deoxy-D-mannose reductase
MKRVLMSGAGGFFAPYFRVLLEARGIAVVPIGRESHPRSDLTHPEPWARELEAQAPDAVLHLAGCMTSQDLSTFYRVNVGFAAALFEGARRVGFPADKPILVLGSAAEIGVAPDGERPILETAPLRPLGHYGISKVAQTELALSESRSRAVVVARVFNLVGSLALGHFARSIAEVAKQGKSGSIRVGNLEAVRDFIDPRDAARLCLALLEDPRARGAVTNVASGSGVRLSEALDTLIRVSGLEISVEPDPARMKPADVPFSVGSPARLTELVGPLELMSLEQSLADVYRSALGSDR